MRFERRLRSRILAVTSAMLTAIMLWAGISSAEDAHEQNRDPIGIWNAVFTLTNEPSGNELAVFAADGNGGLDSPVFYKTGGNGTGGGLGNQGALALGHNWQYLYAVNPGSNTISVFHLGSQGPKQVQVISSNGTIPVSLTVHDNLLYVLNAGGAVAGGTDSISGFRIKGNGTLTAIAKSQRYLSAANTGPAQISFDASGTVLTVTEKGTNTITLFEVEENHLPGFQTHIPSNGATPFGFAFTNHNLLIVSEAFGGAAGKSAVSSYWLDAYDGILQTVSHSVNVGQSAACWIAITHNNKFTYTTNTGSKTVTGFSIANNGALTPLDTNGITAVTSAAPTDVVAYGNQSLFVLDGGRGSIETYSIAANGALTQYGITAGLPLTRPTGLVVR